MMMEFVTCLHQNRLRTVTIRDERRKLSTYIKGIALMRNEV